MLTDSVVRLTGSCPTVKEESPRIQELLKRHACEYSQDLDEGQHRFQEAFTRLDSNQGASGASAPFDMDPKLDLHVDEDTLAYHVSLY